MFKTYIKQAWQIIRQNPFISIISILGTALAIMMIMTIVVADAVRMYGGGAEPFRDRSIYMDKRVTRDTVHGGMSSGGLEYSDYRNFLSKTLKTPEYVAAFAGGFLPSNISTPGSRDYHYINVKATNYDYWKVFEIPLLKGRYFTPEEVESSLQVAVINESTAKTVFMGEEPVGKTLQIDFMDYRIVGVAKDISGYFEDAYGQIWRPYEKDEDNMVKVVAVTRSYEDHEKISREVREAERLYDIENAPWTLWIQGPHQRREYLQDLWVSSPEDYDLEQKVNARKRIIILAILLLIPAVNLSGFSLSRIRKRRAEIGVRKAFGAKKYTILMQVLYENFLTSIIGGLVGLVLSFGMVSWLRDWLLDLSSEANIPVQSFFSWQIFFWVFLICIVLNLLSAGIPAWRASRMSIVNSINQNDK